MSPIKQSEKNPRTRYFTGKISDRKRTMQVVSFDPKLRQDQDVHLKKGMAVALTDCQVKEGTASVLEIMTSSRLPRTVALKSARTFELPADLRAIDPDAAVRITLDELQGLAINQCVIVNSFPLTRNSLNKQKPCTIV